MLEEPAGCCFFLPKPLYGFGTLDDKDIVLSFARACVREREREREAEKGFVES